MQSVKIKGELTNRGSSVKKAVEMVHLCT